MRMTMTTLGNENSCSVSKFSMANKVLESLPPKGGFLAVARSWKIFSPFHGFAMEN
jgi:hypothetical protein